MKQSSNLVLCARLLQLCLTLCEHVDCSPPGSSVLVNSPGKNTGVGCHALHPGIEPMSRVSPALASGFFTTSATWEDIISAWEARLINCFSLFIPQVWKVKVLVTQSCPTLCNPINYKPAGSTVHRILQARILEWVAISFSRESSWPRDWTRVSCIAGRFFTIWTTREAHILRYNAK